ncbi:MAG: DinB family protein [Candidatus Acidiferrales bacterium]
MPMNQALLPEFDHEMANTRKSLERAPDEKWTWKPHEKSGQMGWLVTHLANLPGWGADVLTSDSFDFAPGGKMVEMPKAATTKEALALFDKNVAATRAALSSASDEQLMKPWSLLQNGKPIFTMPRVAVFRSMILNHSIHHRAQLGVYFRLNGVAVPGIYGPSADEQPS